MRSPPVSIHRFVDRLAGLEDPGAITDWIGACALDERSLRPFIHYRSEKHARNLVVRTPNFDVIVLCWRPGQCTPVHNHNGQRGWVRVLRGRLVETSYAQLARPARLPVSEPERGACVALAGAPLERRSIAVVSAGPSVVSVDVKRAIHRLGNPAEHCGDEDAVSLHVYSKPHDSCLVYDLERSSARRAVLSFDTMAGVPAGTDLP